ncbi:hypothetical protein LTR53_002879 [Teratosphaeriaceae sp. CCFEE 6253]|nr:hypothetical protein LTR53_002879 [Teratosphaeriaceae sp. CCFEE 6253]
MLATEEVFITAELLEQTLLHLPLRTLLLSRRVSKYFDAVIEGSSKIRKALWLEPAGGISATWVPDEPIDGESAVSLELGTWRVGTEVSMEVRTVVPMLNPFLTITTKVLIDGPETLDSSNFKGYSGLSIELAPGQARCLTFTNDGLYETRLDLKYKYSAETTPTSADSMLLTYPLCSAVRLIHRSVDPFEDCPPLWASHGLRKSEFDIVSDDSGGTRLGKLLKEIRDGAPTIADQDEYQHALSEEIKYACRLDLDSLFDGENDAQRAGQACAGEAQGSADVSGETQIESVDRGLDDTMKGIEKHETVQNCSHGTDSPSSPEAATVSATQAESAIRAKPAVQTDQAEDHIAANGIVKSSLTFDSDHAEVDSEGTGAPPCYTAEYAIIGATHWCIPQVTVDTITGWDMLSMFRTAGEGLLEIDSVQ